MATNKAYELGIALPMNVGTTVKSGDPVVCGSIPGVATRDADGTTGVASVDMQGVYNLSVKGIDGSGNAAVNAGDALYFVAADTPKLSKKTTGVLFGYVYSPTVAGGSQVIASGATATIPVILART